MNFSLAICLSLGMGNTKCGFVARMNIFSKETWSCIL